MLATDAVFFSFCCCYWFTFPLPHLSPPYICGLPLAHSCVARSCFDDIISIMNNMEPTRLLFFKAVCSFFIKREAQKKKKTFPSSWLGFFLIKCTYTYPAFMCLQAPVECKLYSLLFLLHACALFSFRVFFVVAQVSQDTARGHDCVVQHEKKKAKPDIIVSCK